MTFRGLLFAGACAALVLVPGAAPAQAPQLFGTVGPGFTIALRDAGGSFVTQIDPGTYEIEVRDLSEDHNFRLSGPGVNQATSVPATGTVTWTVTFREGRYTYVCDPHSTQMEGQLTVGNPPPEVKPPPPPASTPRLLATVGPRNTISLRNAAGGVLRNGVKAGTYSIAVRDRSRVHNFHLVGRGVNRRSGLSATGTTTWKVRLAPGPLRFYSDKAPKTVKGSVTVRSS